MSDDTTVQALAEVLGRARFKGLGAMTEAEACEYMASAVLDSGLVVPAAALAERDASIARARDLHRERRSGNAKPGWCRTCVVSDGMPAPWPCATRRALDGTP